MIEMSKNEHADGNMLDGKQQPDLPTLPRPYTPPVVTDLGAFANPTITGSGRICCEESFTGDESLCECA